MLNRLVRYALVGVFAMAVAGYGNVAFAQDDDDAAGDDAAGDDAAGDDAAGGDDAGGGDATGDDAAGGDDMAAAPAEGGAPPMILAKGKIAVGVSVQVSLISDFIAKPLSIQPDVWYGVMPKLEVGVAHSSYGINGFWGTLGGGICVSGTDGGCAKAYNGPVGVIAHYLLMEGSIDLAADAGVVIRQLSDPMMLGVKLGVMGRKVMGKLMIGFAPNLYAGLTERDFNKEAISVPVDVMFMATPKLAAGVQTGIAGPLDGFGDAYVIPLSIGAMFMATPAISVGGAFNFYNIAGKGSTADARGLTVFATWHN